MRCLSKPVDYKGFTLTFDLQVGVTFTDGSTEWAARSYRHARERIDRIVAERDLHARRAAVAAGEQLPLI